MTHNYTYTNKYCNPKRLVEELNAYVMGQNAGIRTVATAVSQHLMSLSYPDDAITTDNVLIVGPTGCGKTETIRCLQRLQSVFHIPVLMVNVLDYAPTGSWQGVSVTDIFQQVMIRAADLYFDEHDKNGSPVIMTEDIIEIANKAIIIIDEFDKIAVRGAGGTENGRHFQREYQANLLKIIEGNEYHLNDFSFDESEPVVDPETGELKVVTKTTKLTDITLSLVFPTAWPASSDAPICFVRLYPRSPTPTRTVPRAAVLSPTPVESRPTIAAA